MTQYRSNENSAIHAAGSFRDVPPHNERFQRGFPCLSDRLSSFFSRFCFHCHDSLCVSLVISRFSSTAVLSLFSKRRLSTVLKHEFNSISHVLDERLHAFIFSPFFFFFFNLLEIFSNLQWIFSKIFFVYSYEYLNFFIQKSTLYSRNKTTFLSCSSCS